MIRLGRNQRAALEAAARVDPKDGTTAASVTIRIPSRKYHVHAEHHSHEYLHDTRAAYHVFRRLEERGLVQLDEEAWCYRITDRGREALMERSL